MLDKNRLDYLRALARQQRKRMDRKLGRFAPKGDQSPQSAAEAHRKLQRARDYAAQTEEILREAARDYVNEGGS